MFYSLRLRFRTIADIIYRATYYENHGTLWASEAISPLNEKEYSWTFSEYCRISRRRKIGSLAR
jgi:hypothetical protein